VVALASGRRNYFCLCRGRLGLSPGFWTGAVARREDYVEYSDSMAGATPGSENISENKNAPSQSRLFAPTRLPQFALYAAISIVVLIPCYWHRYIQAGDLGSHVYNAWLAQLVEQGKAPGVYVVWQWQNALFDLMLFYFAKVVGLAAGEKLAVSVCVLVFFWGAVAFLAAVTKQKPWHLTPVIAMLAYGYVFHMGFMNYYLSIGLACIGLALFWPLKRKGIAMAVILAPFILLAHPLGFLWFLGVAVYRALWLKLQGWWKFAPWLAAISCVVVAHSIVLKNPNWDNDWPDPPKIQWNGADQLFVYDDRYFYLSLAVLAFGVVIAIAAAWRAGRRAEYWKQRRIILELYVVCLVASLLLPENLRTDSSGGWIGALVTRLTLISAIVGLGWLAWQPRKKWHLLGFAACAVAFFGLLFQDSGFLNRMEENARQITSQLPQGTRVLATIFAPDEYRAQFLHIADRACVGRCFLYSDYEPPTKQFRLRVHDGSPIVNSVVDENGDMEAGVYEVQEKDLPLKEIYQCDEDDLTKLCIRDLQVGEKNGRLGYHPDLNPMLPTAK